MRIWSMKLRSMIRNALAAKPFRLFSDFRNRTLAGHFRGGNGDLLERLGTAYGGRYVPRDMKLNANSFIISAGVGEDMSFDLLLQVRYGCEIVLVDPTPRAITHFSEIQQFYSEERQTFSGAIQNDYLHQIQAIRPDLAKFFYEPKALWNASDLTIPFYKPRNPAHVSHTLVAGMYAEESSKVRTVSLKQIMETQGQGRPLDLLKMDIEGAELVVLDHMLAQEIFPRYLLVEFDLMDQPQDANNNTGRLIQALRVFYDLVKQDKKNLTFVLKQTP